MTKAALIAALEWYDDMGVTIAVEDEPQDRMSDDISGIAAPPETTAAPAQTSTPAPAPQKTNNNADIKTAQKIAAACTSLDELRAAIIDFDAHPLKKTSTKMVFGAGNPDAKIMVIGDPPSNTEDRSGEAYSGDSGTLLDKILNAIALSRDTVYMTHITHWRPPGNSTPSEAHLALSKPFIARQIELVKPQFIIIMGGSAANTLIESDQSLSRIRGQWFDYGADKIPALVTYSPDFLLKNPLQKRKVWHDMLAFQEKLNA